MLPLPVLFVAALGPLLAVPLSTLPPAGERPRVFHLDAKLEQDVGYAQAVRVGNTLHISGTVGSGAMPDAIREAYSGIQKTLAAHGLGFEHVVRETVFTTRLDDFIAHRAVRRTFYGTTLPAASWVEVRRLYLPEFVVEVEVTAAFPASRSTLTAKLTPPRSDSPTDSGQVCSVSSPAPPRGTAPAMP